MDKADRRFDLIALVLNAEDARGRGRKRPRGGLVCLCQGDCEHVAHRLRDGVDLDWVTRELAQVKAEPGEYPAESYERWRLHGLPIWAALAAGMTPTPGSRKLSRRPRLP